MMQKIRFRGRKKGTENNPEWVEGDLLRTDDRNGICHTLICREHDCRPAVRFEVDPETAGLCSDITDKNGKVLFEGDIIRMKSPDRKHKFTYYGTIRFGKYEPDDFEYDAYLPYEHLGFYIEWDNSNNVVMRPNILRWHDMCECVGNIYDNPDLVKSHWKDSGY